MGVDFVLAVQDAKRRYSVARRAAAAVVTTKGTTGYQGLSDGTQTGVTYRTRHVAAVDASRVQIAVGNFYGNGGSAPLGQFDGANAISVKVLIEDANANQYPVFFNGVRTVTLDPGAMAISDVCGIELVAGASYFVRLYVSVVSLGQKWPLGALTTSALSEGSTNGSDLTNVGSAAVTNVSSNAFGPLAILGVPSGSKSNAVAIVGDSIAQGSHDSATGVGTGYFARAFNSLIPFMWISQPGEQAFHFASVLFRLHRTRLLEHCTYAVCDYGRNDVTNSRTAAQIKADLLTIWTALSRHGVKVAQVTITPVTTSTDTWATTGNQTSSANDSVRVAVNAWLRDGAPIDATSLAAVAVGTNTNVLRAGAVGHPLWQAPTLSGNWDVAAVVETAVDSGIWKATGSAQGWSFDGTHPSATGYASIASSGVIPTALLVAA